MQNVSARFATPGPSMSRWPIWNRAADFVFRKIRGKEIENIPMFCLKYHFCWKMQCVIKKNCFCQCCDKTRVMKKALKLLFLQYFFKRWFQQDVKCWWLLFRVLYVRLAAAGNVLIKGQKKKKKKRELSRIRMQEARDESRWDRFSSRHSKRGTLKVGAFKIVGDEQVCYWKHSDHLKSATWRVETGAECIITPINPQSRRVARK